MTKQPVLTGFPHHVFATAKRRAQAAIQRCRQQLVQSSISGYGVMFSKVLPSEFLSEVDPTKRQRLYGHLPVFWAWIGQVLEANASCTKAVSMVQAWCRALGLPVPTSDSSPYCQGRMRLHDGFLRQVDTRIRSVLEVRITSRDRWRGHALKAIDGTTVTLMDTPDNQLAYPQPCRQKAGCGFPVMGIVGMVNLSHGGVEGFETCGFRKHDARIAPQLLKYVEEEDIILGDRAFCSFEFIVRIVTERKGHVIMRLHQSRHRKLDWRRGKRVSPIADYFPDKLFPGHPEPIRVGSVLENERSTLGPLYGDGCSTGLLYRVSRGQVIYRRHEEASQSHFSSNSQACHHRPPPINPAANL